MARDTTVYSLAYAATMIGEARELIEVVAGNPDDIDDGEMIHVHDGTEEGMTAFTRRGIEGLKEALVEIRSAPGGVRQYLIDQQCEPDLIQRIMPAAQKR